MWRRATNERLSTTGGSDSDTGYAKRRMPFLYEATRGKEPAKFWFIRGTPYCRCLNVASVRWSFTSHAEPDERISRVQVAIREFPLYASPEGGFVSCSCI